MTTKRRTDYPKMRGIEAFLSSPSADDDAVPVQSLPIDSIYLPKHQPRYHFDPQKMEQLVRSIQQHGILEPLLVRPIDGGNYELVAGERRYRAAQTLGLLEVPVVIRAFNEQDAWQVALIENLQRDDLNPVEETEGLLELMSLSQGISKEEAIALLNYAANAKRRGHPLTDNVVRQLQAIEDLFAATSGITPESFRSHRLPLLNLPPDVLAALREDKLSYTKAKAIARIADEHERAQLLNEAIAEKLSLSQIQERIRQNTPTKTRSLSLKQQFKTTYQQLQQSPCWDNPKHQKRLKKLLAQMEDLLSQ
jgi:ParB family transcriptional regulator, chromosome partitioning protein